MMLIIIIFVLYRGLKNNLERKSILIHELKFQKTDQNKKYYFGCSFFTNFAP